MGHALAVMDTASLLEVDYEIEEKIGHGLFGAVYKGVDIRTNHRKALKKVPLVKGTVKEYQQVLNEPRVLSMLDHPNIVKCDGYFNTKNGEVCIVMELCEGGDLRKRIDEEIKKRMGHTTSNGARLDWKECARPIISALAYLEAKGIKHCDLKPENILFFRDGTLLLCDFGHAKGPHSNRADDAGDTAYLSPQIRRGDEYSTKTDIWSFGGILFDLAMEDRIWREVSLYVIENGHLPKSVSDPFLQQLLDKALVDDESKRSSASELLAELEYHHGEPSQHSIIHKQPMAPISTKMASGLNLSEAERLEASIIITVVLTVLTIILTIIIAYYAGKDHTIRSELQGVLPTTYHSPIRLLW